MHRPYKLPNQTEIASIHRGVESAFKKWCNAWCQDDALSYAMDVEAIDSTSARLVLCQSKWLIGGLENGIPIGLQWTEQLPALIYDSFVKIPTAFKRRLTVTTPVAHKLVNSAMVSLLNTVVKEVLDTGDNAISVSKREHDAFSADLSSPGAGYVLVAFDFNQTESLRIVIDSNYLANQTVNTKTQPVSATAFDAVGHGLVKIEAVIGTSELDVKALTNLAVGDVISVDKKLSDKVSLYISGEQVCQGYLGKVGETISVKVDNTI